MSQPPNSHLAALQHHVQEQAEDARICYLERWETDFRSMQSGEEREAERVFGGYLLTINDGYKDLSFHAMWGKTRDPNWGTIMGYRVELGAARADFLFKVCNETRHRLLAVNLDPSNSRRRNGEAIKRDRALMNAGCRVLSFTDREVLEAPLEKAEEVSSALSDLVEDLWEELRPRRRAGAEVVPISDGSSPDSQ